MKGKRTMRAIKKIARVRSCSEEEACEFLQKTKALMASTSVRCIALAVEQLEPKAPTQDVAQLARKIHQQILAERKSRRQPIFETTGGQVRLIKPGYYKDDKAR